MSRFQTLYHETIVPELIKKFGYKTVMQVPRITKITLNMGVGEAVNDKKLVDNAVGDLTKIAGQKPAITRTRKAIANFKIRENMPIGCMVTLRGERMYDFLDRLVTIAFPRVRDFRGVSGRAFDGRGNYNIGLREQIIFPSPENIAALPRMIEEAGGIEVCYGGIGIHGHVAFNEPEPGVRDSDPRILSINEFTRTIDATRHKGVGGNLENFPRRAITLGMKQCLGARRMLLMTRNESQEFFWANTVLRISALGEPGDDYPVTHARHHRNLLIVTDVRTATAPKFNI